MMAKEDDPASLGFRPIFPGVAAPIFLERVSQRHAAGHPPRPECHRPGDAFATTNIWAIKKRAPGAKGGYIGDEMLPIYIGIIS